jgi:Methyltransferase domain
MLMSLEQALPYMASPDTARPLIQGQADLRSIDNSEVFALKDGCPFLFPAKLRPFLGPTALDVPWSSSYDDPLLEYAVLVGRRQNNVLGNNADTGGPWYIRHCSWVRTLVRVASGTVLDIGCDNPTIGSSLFPPDVTFLGLDSSYRTSGPFRLLGLAEFLPLRDNTFDNVCFLTSLDHILDYKRAVEEAFRVLKPGGSLYVSSLVWRSGDELFTDAVHFHHFSEGQLLDALRAFSIQSLSREGWKHARHRSVMLVSATKPE